MKATYHRTFTAAAFATQARRATAALAICTALALCAPAARGVTLIVTGAGDGHGVGMSQEGALGYAQHGYPYTAILAHYYTGTAIGKAPAKWKVRVLMGGKVKRIPLEAYVRGVVGAEMSPSWPMAALEAQAVASRTYALTSHAGGSRFNVYADTRSQVYRGKAAESAASNEAVQATAGEIVTYAGKPAITYFFASSGGMTESVQNAFPGAAPEPWLQGVPDPFDAGPLHSWRTSLSFKAATDDLKGLVRGVFRGIEVVKRGVSPRIISANVLGSKGATPISGDELAARLNLYDTWAYFSVSDTEGTGPEPDRSGTPDSTSGTPTPATAPAQAGAGGGTSAGPSPGPGGGTAVG
jgi:stage II sporulation protein D